MRGYTQAEVTEAFHHLGVTPADFMGIRQCRSLREAELRLQKLRERVKERWRKLAFELHPDRTDGDEDKTRLFKLLSGVVDKLNEVKVMPPRPRVRRVVMQQPIVWATNSTNATSTSTSTWGSWVPGGVPAQVWVNGRRVA
jgi:hypothetical protein